MKEKIKVLIVDDAIVVRILVGTAVSQDPDLEVVGKSPDGKDALEKIAQLQPDVVVLDIEMPEIDGLEVLRRLKNQGMPTKVIMFSTYTTVGAEQTFEALELGAIDFVPKPSSTGFSKGFEKIKDELLAKIKFAGSSESVRPTKKAPRVSTSRITATTSYEVVFFEGGMGAPRTFMNIIPELPNDLPCGVLIFQTMFSGFAEQFVRRLSKSAQIEIKAAEDSQTITPGTGLVLFGDHYAAVKRSGSNLQLAFREKESTEKYGSVPRILSESLAKTCGKKAIGVILAGAGEGNFAGIQAIKEYGGLILAEEPSTIVGRQVLDQLIERELVDESVSTHNLISSLKRFLGAA